MELASIELTAIVSILNSVLEGYYINNIYRIDENTILVRFHHGERPDRRLMVSSGRGVWLTNSDLVKEGTKGIIPTLRKKLSRARFIEVEQPAGERIIIMKFRSSGEFYKLIGEFFSNGNIILTNNEDRVIMALKALRVKHREIKAGGNYSLPPARGLDISTVTLDIISPLISSDLEVSRWLMGNFSLSRKYVNEILTRTQIEYDSRGNSLTNEDLVRLYNCIREVFGLTLSGEKQSQVIYENEKPIDVTPFPFEMYRLKESKKVSSFIEGIDEVFSKEIVSKSFDRVQEPARRKIAELDKSIQEQNKDIENSKKCAQSLRQMASQLTQNGNKKLTESLELVLPKKEIHSSKGNFLLKIEGIKFQISEGGSIFTLVSRIYDESKKLEKRVKAIENAESALRDRKEKLVRNLEVTNTVDENITQVTSRQQHWYEKYRWFITSENLLAVGGRDASSNTSLIKKHATTEDLIFHAEIHGSPFFILKNGKSATEKSIIETAQAVVGFSRAWREGISSSDAYWINLNQIKSHGPSGMFVPKGGFIIEGKKNYLRGLESKIGIGVQESEEELIIFGGDSEAVRINSLAYVILSPDRHKVSETAKKVKSNLVKNIDEKYSGKMKKVSIDAIIRAMPAGGGNILSSGIGEKMC